VRPEGLGQLEVKHKISLQQFLPLSEAEIQFPHSARSSLGYFLASFQAECPLAPKSHVSLNSISYFSYFYRDYLQPD
jgi:hypothetical protein